jgi:predicted Na+-dependent transporter
MGADHKGGYMLFDLNTGAGFSALSLTLILSFFLAYSIDTIMGRQGFGIWGNMIIINIQFQVGLWLSKVKIALHLSNVEHMITALAFTFATILILAYVRSVFLKN